MTTPTTAQRITLALFLALAFALCCHGIASARAPQPDGATPIERLGEHWTPEARVWLARCVVGESSWLRAADHIAHADAVLRQWETRRRAGKRLTFERQTHLYCKALNSRARPWLRELPPTSLQAWPRGAGPNMTLWLATLQRIDEWARGLWLSPCPGAEHWGSRKHPVDGRRAARALRAGRWVVVACLEITANRFYRRTSKRRSRIESPLKAPTRARTIRIRARRMAAAHTDDFEAICKTPSPAERVPIVNKGE